MTKVIQPAEKPVPAQVLAESIRAIGKSVRKLDASGLSEKAIELLLSHARRNVLWALRNLERIYLKKK